MSGLGFKMIKKQSIRSFMSKAGNIYKEP